MGTFHHDRGELHGITVIVETDGPEVWVGRCDTRDERGILLRDADVHRDGPEGPSREQFLRRASEVGVWPRHRHVVIPNERIAAVRLLAEG